VRLLASSALLTLAWYAAANAVASLGAWLAAGRLCRQAEALGARPRPGLLLTVRLFPAVAAATIAFVVFLPAHLAYEPRDLSETFGASVWILAALGCALFSRTLLHVMRAFGATRRLRAAWTSHGHTGTTPIVPDQSRSGVSLAGIMRSTIVVGASAHHALTSDELEVAVAHELAHRDAWDNLKRFAMFASPDVFACTRMAARLEHVWHAEVECQADARAVRGDDGRAATLASALLKVARLASPASVAPLMWSAFHDHAILERRVRLLVGGHARQTARTVFAPAAAVLALAVAVTGAAYYTDLPHSLHVVTELFIGTLP